MTGGIELYKLARRYHQSGDLAAARRDYRKVLDDFPGNAEVMYWLGVLEFQDGKLAEAESQLGAAASLLPDNASVLYSLGVVMAAAGRYEEAITTYRRSIEIKPDFSEAFNNLGISLAAVGAFAEATDAYQKALHLKPDSLDAWINLGVALYGQGRGEETVNAFMKVLDREPDNVYALQNLGNAWYEQGYFEEAIGCYQKVLQITSLDGSRIRIATALPMIMSLNDHIHLSREHIQKSVAALYKKDIRINDPLKEIGYTNFLLAYHGRNDRDIQKRIAELYLKICPTLSYVAPHCKSNCHRGDGARIRIGFISRFLKNHSIGKTSKGIIKHLSRAEFEVVVIFLEQPADATSQYIAEVADQVVVLPNNLVHAQECIANQKLDILFYQDTGMDAFTFFLAFSRLAPVQCTSFGHPVTTGIPNIDYYISTDYWEPEDAQEHYSEKLSMLKDVASVAYYYKPELPDTLKPREYFGLNENEHIYICPQTLFKLHPDFDSIIKGILEADKNGRVVMLEGKHGHWSELLRERFHSAIPGVAEQITFLPQQAGGDFINLVAVSDVMLDTTHFCGFNTSLEGFSVGVPVVTLPGKYMRSRHTMSFYRKMQYMECVAENIEDYISIALRLGNDRAYREQASHRIMERQACLWEEMKVVTEFERVFKEMIIHAST